MTRIEVIGYTENYRKDIILALVALQEHEHSLSNSRKAASYEVGERAFNEMQRDCNNKNGAILISLKDQQFAGFVTYHYESTSLSYETVDSNNYALISNSPYARAFILGLLDCLKEELYLLVILAYARMTNVCWCNIS